MSIDFDQVTEQATKYAKDSVYLTVGLAAVTSTAKAQLEVVDARVTDLESRFVEFVDERGDRLPEAARTAVGKAIETGRSARAQWLAMLLPEDAKAA